MRTYASIDEFFKSPLFTVLAIVIFFGLIVIGVILVKKYVKPFQNTEKPKSDKEIAEEEVNRLVTDITDEETIQQMNEAARELEKDADRPTEKEVAEEEVSRATEEVLDEATAEAMRRYAEEHPEEAAVFEEKEDKE